MVAFRFWGCGIITTYIALTSISVRNLIEAFKFYTEKLGFAKKSFIPEMNLAIVTAPDDPDGTALLLEPRGNLGSGENFEGLYNAGISVIVFGSKDIEGECGRLRGKGVHFTKQPSVMEWGKQALFDDTCGNLI